LEGYRIDKGYAVVIVVREISWYGAQHNKKSTWTVQIQNNDTMRMQHKVIICDRVYIDYKEEYSY